MAPAATQKRHVAFEVHLPEQIRRGLLKALLRRRSARCGNDPTVPAKDLVHCRMRWTGVALPFEAVRDLAGSPCRMRIAQRQNAGLDRRCGPGRARMRPPRTIRQLFIADRATKPLVAGVSMNPEPPAQFAPVRSFLPRQPDKLTPLVHLRHLAPRHGWPP
jgi:hypothetical protein